MSEVKLTREQLKEIEWSASSYPEDSRCPVCNGWSTDNEFPHGSVGHAPDCWLGKAVSGK
jgi:hypothetical protein